MRFVRALSQVFPPAHLAPPGHPSSPLIPDPLATCAPDRSSRAP